MNERENLMKQLMAYSFAAYEWALYLNTHPNDAMALSMFKNMNKKAQALKAQYAEKYGPLSHSDVDTADGWTWVQDPWPWNEGGIFKCGIIKNDFNIQLILKTQTPSLQALS